MSVSVLIIYLRLGTRPPTYSRPATAACERAQAWQGQGYERADHAQRAHHKVPLTGQSSRESARGNGRYWLCFISLMRVSRCADVMTWAKSTVRRISPAGPDRVITPWSRRA